MKAQILDVILTSIYRETEGGEYAPIISQYLIIAGLAGKGVPEHEKVNVDRTIRYLEDRKLVYHSPINYKYYITVEGVVFYERPIWIYRNKPFVYERRLEQLGVIWKVIKVVAGVLNALAIIYLAYLQLQGSS